MEALLASAAVYLAIGWQAAESVIVPTDRSDLVSQLRIAGAVLWAGLLWPRLYWRMLKEDWDNHYTD